MDAIFPLLIFAIVIVVAFVFFSGKGKALLFGGKIVKTMESVTKGKKRLLISTDVKVHVIEISPTARNIGLEITNTSGLSYNMVPVSLPISEAKILADTIYAAIEHQGNGN